MPVLVGVLVALLVLVVVIVLGLSVRPRAFAAFEGGGDLASLSRVPVPEGLPAPVDRFIRVVYGDTVPVIESAVCTGRATIRPFMNIPLPARFRFSHRAGYDYRHYIEATIFGQPLLKVDEGYVDGVSFFESPMESHSGDPHTNQAANVALWAEGAMFPSLYITDPRVRWAPVDDDTAILYVPFEDRQESFVVRFSPQTGLIDLMEAMRYRNPGDRHRVLWITRGEPGPVIPDTPLAATGSATWLDQGRPWASFTTEEIRYNADLDVYIQQRGE